MPELFEAFQYGIPSAIIVLVYLLVTKWIDSKEKKKTVEINAQLIDCFNELNNYLKHITKDIVDKEDDRINMTVKLAFKEMAYDITKYATYTIINNNITANRVNIISNIKTTVQSCFSSCYSALLLYTNAENHLADYIKDEWKEAISSAVINIIFDENLSVQQRIYNIHSKLDIQIKEYVTDISKLI